MTADEKYVRGTENEFDQFCDDHFSTDAEVEKYCKEKNIPVE